MGSTDARRPDLGCLARSDLAEVDAPGPLGRLRRHPRWLAVGILVAAAAAASRFAAIGLLPPSIKFKSLAHTTATTEIAVGANLSLSLSQAPAVPDQYGRSLPTRALALGDMIASPQLKRYVAQTAGLPASEIAIDAPLWIQLQRDQQWATGQKRASQIVVERDPYHISLNTEFEAPVIEVSAQAPTTQAAARLAHAVPIGLSAYLSNLQTKARTPLASHYDVEQLAPVAVNPSSSSGPANVAIFTFLAVFLLWCGLCSAHRPWREIFASPTAA